MSYLFETLEKEFGRRSIQGVKIPEYIKDSLTHEIRPYQEEAFQRFLLCYEEDFEGKPARPLHLLYNMATGSGKTLVMAGLILYLYKQGYRNFLFFVHTTNIIQKTKENFLNANASKYLFSEKVVIDGKEVYLKEVDTFEESDPENINIKFTTIQQLHLDLNTPRENQVTYEDFKTHKVVLIADEAHHLSSGSRQGKLEGSWENTVEKIHHSHWENILLEFTATLDYDNREIVDKYKDKVIYRYDLPEFRQNGYSKEISLIRSEFDEKERISQALILNLYRQELATSHGINLKPVILFKAKRTIKESEANKDRFHKLIEELSEQDILKVRDESTVDIVQKAFSYFKKAGFSESDIVKKLQNHFKPENCLSANNDKEAESNQIKLNTLEDGANPIRAIFAVSKLNEGWDVLNLFDIVRLYSGRDGKAGKPGKTTIAEAQLIGRGARYYPFALDESEDPYRRKFDHDRGNDLKVLEELYYHTIEDSRYISELKTALKETGIYEDEDNFETKLLSLKPEFKKTLFYQKGRVFLNDRKERSYEEIRSFLDLGVTRKNVLYRLSSGDGKETQVFDASQLEEPTKSVEQIDISVLDIPQHIIRYALAKNPFYRFDEITRYFPQITSLSEFMKSKEYLGGLEITFEGQKERVYIISPRDYLLAVQLLLQEIENEVKNNLTQYEGSAFKPQYVHEVFLDSIPVKVSKIGEGAQERLYGQKEFLENKKWYAYDANYGTSEERAFVEMFNRRFENLKQNLSQIYLVRNERKLAIYNKAGQRFEPDFVLFGRKKDTKELVYQVFIEPKGAHLKTFDKWKEDFLRDIRDKEQVFSIDSDKYVLTAVPFYNNEDENEFRDNLEGIFE